MDTTTKTTADLESIARNPASALSVRYAAALALMKALVPDYPGRPTPTQPIEVAGVLFFTWNEGIGHSRTRSLCGRAVAFSNYGRPTYSALVLGRPAIGSRFRSLEAACEAAARALVAGV